MDTEPNTASPNLRATTPPVTAKAVSSPDRYTDTMPANPHSRVRTSPANSSTSSPTNTSPSGVILTPGFKAKAPPKSLFEKFTPKGCFDTLVKCEERGILEGIEEEVEEITSNKPDPVIEHAYIDALLRGLNQATEISVKPMKEILKDCRLDSSKGKYLERIVNCYSRASLLSKLATFTDQVQEVCGDSPDINTLGQGIMTCLIDLNPQLVEIIESTNARTNEWRTEDDLNRFISNRITPPVKKAIKNLFLSTFNYKPERDDIFLEPNADSNDMRLKIHEERLSRCEKGLTKVEVIGETIAREVADLKLAKASSAFATEDKCLRLNPQDREGWGKKSEDERRSTIQDLVTKILGDEESKKVNIRLIKESQRNPAWIKLFLQSADRKFKFEVGLRDVRNSEASKKKKSGERNSCFTSIRLTPMSFRSEEKNMRRLAIQKLSKDWTEELKRQKVSAHFETSIDRLETMWQLRLKWKNSPTFSIWLEFQDPIHRHSWMPINMYRDNLFDLYDFNHGIPDPKTREMAKDDPSYLVPRHKNPREVEFCKKARPIQTPSKERKSSLGVKDLISKQNDTKNKTAAKALQTGNAGQTQAKTPKKKETPTQSSANKQQKLITEVEVAPQSQDPQNPTAKEQRIDLRKKKTEELAKLTAESLVVKILGGKVKPLMDDSKDESIEQISSGDEEVTKTPSLPVSSGDESLEESEKSEEDTEKEQEARSLLEIAASVPLIPKETRTGEREEPSGDETAKVNNDAENETENEAGRENSPAANSSEKANEASDKEDSNNEEEDDEEDHTKGQDSGTEEPPTVDSENEVTEIEEGSDSVEPPTGDSHKVVSSEDEASIKDTVIEVSNAASAKETTTEETSTKSPANKEDNHPPKSVLTVDTSLQTPGNSITVNSPLVTDQPKSPSVDQLKEMFEGEAKESVDTRKSSRKKKSSPKKTPDTTEEKPSTPTGVSSKSLGQLSIQEAMKNSGKKAGARNRATKSKLKPPASKRNVNFQEESL